MINNILKYLSDLLADLDSIYLFLNIILSILFLKLKEIFTLRNITLICFPGHYCLSNREKNKLSGKYFVFCVMSIRNSEF